jgi:hypothetical protein
VRRRRGAQRRLHAARGRLPVQREAGRVRPAAAHLLEHTREQQTQIALECHILDEQADDPAHAPHLPMTGAGDGSKASAEYNDEKPDFTARNIVRAHRFASRHPHRHLP